MKGYYEIISKDAYMITMLFEGFGRNRIKDSLNVNVVFQFACLALVYFFIVEGYIGN